VWIQSSTTMSTDINQYLKLQTALLNEKAKLEARLAEISKVLGGTVSVAASAPSPSTITTKGKRTFSDATKAKMRAAQQARWAKSKGSTNPAPAAPKKKRKMSAAGRAAIVAAAKARWAKVKAAKAKAES
jgi:hypothetical protein